MGSIGIISVEKLNEINSKCYTCKKDKKDNETEKYCYECLEEKFNDYRKKFNDYQEKHEWLEYKYGLLKTGLGLIFSIGFHNNIVNSVIKRL